MQILVSNCDNRPPKIETEEVYCVVAGQTLSFDVVVSDADSLQKVRLSALGGPFEQSFSPATLEVASGYQTHPLKGVFTWKTTCEHISSLEYTVVFKAEDNFQDSTGLVDLKTVRIKVVGPPPQDFQANRDEEEIVVSWQKTISV